jgi:hypothetical protein
MKLHCAAMIVLVSLAAADPARAGYWNYSCKGSLDDTTIEFDRNALLIMSKELAKGDIAGLVKSEIFTFDAADNNSGFQPTMNFARGAFPDQKVVLTEKSSKTVSTQDGHVGTREKSTTVSRKTYHYQRLGWSDQPINTDIAMDCIEYSLSAP